MDAIDRAIVCATQAGLPLDPRPYLRVAEAVGVSADEVLKRMRRMLDAGVIRRIGAVPNHYKLGYRANGMSVWDIDDARADELGSAVGALEGVSHCYLRPRRPPHWRYNLFAMLHARDRAEVEASAARIQALLGDACRGHEILYSKRILKKTGLRIGN